MDRIDTPTYPAAPTVTVAQPQTAATGYADLARAEHDRHCARCRTLTEEFAAREAAYGESIRRRDRQQLGLQLATDSDPDMDEALRRVRAPRQAVAA